MIPITEKDLSFQTAHSSSSIQLMKLLGWLKAPMFLKTYFNKSKKVSKVAISPKKYVFKVICTHRCLYISRETFWPYIFMVRVPLGGLSTTGLWLVFPLFIFFCIVPTFLGILISFESWKRIALTNEQQRSLQECHRYI